MADFSSRIDTTKKEKNDESNFLLGQTFCKLSCRTPTEMRPFTGSVVTLSALGTASNYCIHGQPFLPVQKDGAVCSCPTAVADHSFW